MSIRPSAHPRLSWALFGAVSVLVVAASLVAVVPSGNRTTIGLTLWGDLFVIGIAAALTYGMVSPIRDGAGWSTGATGRGLVEAGGSAGDSDGDGGGCG